MIVFVRATLAIWYAIVADAILVNYIICSLYKAAALYWLCLDIVIVTTMCHLQGVVFVKCQTPAVAAAAFNSLNGRFFAGELFLLPLLQ